MSTIKIKGEVYPFKISIDDVENFEDEMDMSIQEFLMKMKAKGVKNLVFKGLETGHRIAEKKNPLTMKDLGGLSFADYPSLVGAINSQFSEGEDGGDPK
jgi:hypothetical protein